MAENDTVERLNRLLRLDYEAIRAYTQALDGLSAPEVRHMLSNFRANHERHVRDIRLLVHVLGGAPIELKRDLRGFFVENYHYVRGLVGEENSLTALKGKEVLTNATYEDVLAEERDPQVRALIQKHHDDEKRHLEYFDRIFDTKPWEERTRRAS